MEAGIADKAGGEAPLPWWQLGPAHVRARAGRLIPKDQLPSLDRQIGVEWNGRSGIRLGSLLVRPEEIDLLLQELGRGICASGIGVKRLPQASDVRSYFTGTRSAAQFLIIDVDLGDFILPVAADECMLEGSSERPFADRVGVIASPMLAHLVEAAAHRDKIAAHEMELRAALEAALAESGCGGAQLWLRMEPWGDRAFVRPSSRQPYDCVTIMLNAQLEWTTSSVGFHDRNSAIELIEGRATEQRRRAAIREFMVESRSAGLVADVALALAAERGIKADQLLRLMKAAGGPEGRCLSIKTNDVEERFIFNEGLLQALIECDEGRYDRGTLYVRGTFPQTLATAAGGVPFTQFLEHPAIRATGAVAHSGRLVEYALVVVHEVWALPVEHLRDVSPEEALSALRTTLRRASGDPRSAATGSPWRSIGVPETFGEVRDF